MGVVFRTSGKSYMRRRRAFWRCRRRRWRASPGDLGPGGAMSLGDVVDVAWRSRPWGGDVAWRCFGSCSDIAGDIAKAFGDVAGDVRGHRLAIRTLGRRCRLAMFWCLLRHHQQHRQDLWRCRWRRWTSPGVPDAGGAMSVAMFGGPQSTFVPS